MADHNKPPLDQAIDRVVDNPGETFDFLDEEHRPRAVLVSARYLAELRRALDDLPPVAPGAAAAAAEVDTTLEQAMEAVLVKFGAPLYGYPNQGDRGDFASDLADAARRVLGAGDGD